MDISVAYFLCLLLTLVLSWATFKYFFRDSGWEDQVSDHMKSLSSFVLYSVVLLIILVGVLNSSDNFLGTLIGLLVSGRHRSSYLGDHQNIELAFFSFAFVFAGAILFQYGFLRMSEYLLARNVPRSKIRSAAIGLVEIQGTVVPGQVLTTPYSKSECVYYRSVLQEYRMHYTSSSGSEYRWDTISTDSHRLPFWAKDETGQILIDPTGAEFEIPQIQSGFLGKDGEENDNQSFSTNVGDKRYDEYFLSPSENVCVLGTVAIRKDTSIHKVIQKGNNNSTFIISDSSKRELDDALKWQMLAGLTYGCSLFIVGLIKILQLSDLL